MFNNFFCTKSCFVRENVGKCGMVRKTTDDKIVRLMCFACRINQAKNTHSEYVILVAFPQQQWLCKRASLLRLLPPKEL